MCFFLVLWALYSNTILCASLPQHPESIRSRDTVRISSSNLLSPAVPAPSSSNSSFGNNLEIVCDARKFGKNLRVESCRNVFKYLMKDEIQYTFAERDSGLPFDVPLPWRTLSKDGLCFIQPVLNGTAILGHASGTEFGQAAYTVFRTCVVQRGMGGIAYKLGGDNNINAVIADYRPHVRCDQTSAPGPSWVSAVAVIANMRARKAFRVFGKYGGEDVEEPLPVILEGADKNCQLKIDIDGPATVSSWYEIWEGASAIAMMCTRGKHKGGKASGLGLGGNIRLELSEVKPEDTVGNASTVSLANATNITLLQGFGAEASSAAGPMAFDQVGPFVLLSTGGLQDNSSVVTLPYESE